MIIRQTSKPGITVLLSMFLFAAGAEAQPKRDQIVRLPPFLATGTVIREWQYAAIPGFEILSCCRARDTREFVREVYWQQASLDEIVPPDLQARDTVPVSLILFSEDAKRAMFSSVLSIAKAQAQQVDGELTAAGIDSMALPEADLIPQLKLWDEDSSGVDIILGHREDGGYGKLGFTPDYLYFLLARRVPPLPPWFIEGVLNFYQTQQVARAADIQAPPVQLHMINRMGIMAGEIMAGGIKDDPKDGFREAAPLPPLSWVAPSVTRLLAAHPEMLKLQPLDRLFNEPAPPAATQSEKKAWFAKKAKGIKVDDSNKSNCAWGVLLPMPELMKDFPSETSTEEDKQAWISKFWIAAQAQLILRFGGESDSFWRREVWQSEIMLFLRWVFDTKGADCRKSIWKLVARAGSTPVTEGMFRECFGMGFEEAQAQMLAYLPTALKRGFVLTPDTSLDVPTVDLRDATAGEQARILGDWQRKEIEFVKESHPEFAGEYAEQAEHTLMDAYDSGVRDPGLLAALGIYEYAMGDTGSARNFLEQAAQAGVVRPQAYVDLARLRYKEALAKPAGGEGRLDSGQAAFVLDSLGSIRGQLPPQLSAYLLAAEVWEHAAAAPAGKDLLLLDEGCAFFPGNAELVRATARLHAKFGP